MTLATTHDQIKHKNCWKCGVAFHCGAQSGGSTRCWCNDLPKLLPVEDRDCLCPACLKDSGAQQHSRPKPPLVEGQDYYAEGNMIVFTALHHLRRGYCCGRDCRHCPYR